MVLLGRFVHLIDKILDLLTILKPGFSSINL